MHICRGLVRQLEFHMHGDRYLSIYMDKERLRQCLKKENKIDPIQILNQNLWFLSCLKGYLTCSLLLSSKNKGNENSQGGFICKQLLRINKIKKNHISGGYILSSFNKINSDIGYQSMQFRQLPLPMIVQFGGLISIFVKGKP